MPESTNDAPPTDFIDQVDRLVAVLDKQLPAKTSSNLLIGTWNVRAFDRFDPCWRSQPGASPIRDRSNVACIAEVVRRFDVVAVQELRRSGQAFLEMMRHLGDRWAFLVTDVTEGRPGNSERLAFVYDTTRLQPSGLACELVVAAQEAAAPGALTQQFARTPYAVSFARDDIRFTLVTLHVLYGDAPADRVPELAAIAQWLARWSARPDPWGENLMVLGDGHCGWWQRDGVVLEPIAGRLGDVGQADGHPLTLVDHALAVHNPSPRTILRARHRPTVATARH